jgi:RNA polymerase sigma factor (sigma-70 family)
MPGETAVTPDMDILGAEDSAELARRIHDGDRAAEARFARLYCDCVFAMALARTGERRAARELMDDVLMAVILALRHGALRDQRRLGGFVYGTAANTINAYFRRRSRQPGTIALDPALPSEDALDEREDDDRRRTVQAAMSLLDPRDRQILQLSLAEGLKPCEIAARLGLSPVTVRQRKCRALRALVVSVGGGTATVKARGMLRR